MDFKYLMDFLYLIYCFMDFMYFLMDFVMVSWCFITHPLFVVVGVGDNVPAVVVVGGGGAGRAVLGPRVVVSAGLGLVRLPAARTQEHRLLLGTGPSAAALLVVLVPHQAGEVDRAALCMCVCVCVCQK